MKLNGILVPLAGLGLALIPTMALSQEVAVARSAPGEIPYVLTYPVPMVTEPSEEGTLMLNHPELPLQCELLAVPVEDTSWTVDSALASLSEDDVAAAWGEGLPGFAVTSKGVVAYASTPALRYEGTSLGSGMGVPVTLVHTETVTGGNGYVIDCFFAADAAEQVRPVVDFIIQNFSTSAAQ